MALVLPVVLLVALAAALTTSVVTPAPATAASMSSTTENETIRLINRARAAVGCRAVVRDARLVSAARNHAVSMADRNYVSHYSIPSGATATTRVLRAGYPSGTGIGEVIAAGRSTPARVVNAWLHSTVHKRILLRCSFTRIGVGYAYNRASTYDYHWVADLATG